MMGVDMFPKCAVTKSVHKVHGGPSGVHWDVIFIRGPRKLVRLICHQLTRSRYVNCVNLKYF